MGAKAWMDRARGVRLLGLCLALGGLPAMQAQSPGATNDVGDGGPATAAVLSSPSGLAVDADGHLYIADRRDNRIRRVDARTGVITTVAGTGVQGFSGDGGPATAAKIAHPELIALDGRGNLFLTDRSNARVRRVDARTGIITTVAGNGTVGYSGDGGPAVEASLSYPFGVFVDAAGDVYIADTENHVIRRVDAATGRIETVAGSGKKGFGGDGGPAVAAQLDRPHNPLVDAAGNLIIGDSENQRIRRVDRTTGVITTLYGTGEQGASRDGIPAREASFLYFGTLLFDRRGDLLLTGWGDHRVRRIDSRTGIITTLAGTGEPGFSGDGGPAVKARIDGAYGMAIDQRGNIYVADVRSRRVRRIDAETGVITTFAGGGPER